MLCLQVRKREPIRIGDDITITVLAGLGNVKLGIEAPRDVQIVRESAVDQTDKVRHAIATSEPLHRVEERMDAADACRPNEADMISAPRAKAMARQVVTLQNALEHLREENAKLRAIIQDREHVE